MTLEAARVNSERGDPPAPAGVQSQAGERARWPRWPGALPTCWLLARHEAAGLLGHLPLYLIMAAGLAASSFLLQSQLNALQTDGPQALADPLTGGLWVVTLVIALYLGLIGAVSLARERERGTLEVLFYGPVTATAVVLARFAGLLAGYVTALAMSVPYFVAVAWLSGFAFSASFGALLALAIALGGPAVALGVLVSCVVRRVRGAVVLFAAVVAILLAIDLTDRVAGAVSTAAGQPDLLAYGRLTLAELAGALSWLSPFAYLSRLADPFTTSDPAIYLQSAGEAALYTAVLLGLAIAVLHRRGVRP